MLAWLQQAQGLKVQVGSKMTRSSGLSLLHGKLLRSTMQGVQGLGWGLLLGVPG